MNNSTILIILMPVMFILGIATGRIWIGTKVFNLRVPSVSESRTIITGDLGGVLENSQTGIQPPETTRSFDFRKQLADVEASPGFSEKSTQLRELLARWAMTNPLEAAAYIRSIKSPALLAEVVPSFVAAWASQDPESAARWTEHEMRGEVQLRATKSLAAEWVKTEPKAAQRWVDAKPDGPLKSAAMQSLFRSWGSISPEAALSALPLRGSAESSPLVAEILIGCADKDFALSHQIAIQEIALNPDANFLNEFVASTGFIDPLRTIDFLNKLPTSVSILESVATAASYAADTNPNDALDWALSQPIETKERAAIITSVATTLALNDPATAMSRVQSLPESEDTKNYVTTAISILAAEHPNETMTWIRKDLKGNRKDEAISAFFRGDKRQTFSADIVALAAEIKDSALRNEALGNYLLRNSSEVPHEKVEEHLHKAGISQAEIDAVLATRR